MMDAWDVGIEGDGGVVTEVVYLPIKSGLNPTDLSHTLHHTLSTIASQPGSLSNHYNYIHEAHLSHIFEIHTKWLSLKHHQDFINSPIYEQFYREVKDVLVGEVGMLHFKAVGGWRVDGDMVKKVMSEKGEVEGDAIANAKGEDIRPRPRNPTIEIATFFSKENSEQVAKVGEFVSILEKEKEKIPGLLGASFGKVLERISPPLKGVGKKEDSGKGGEKEYGEIAILMMPWTDVEAHMAFRDTALFREVVGLLRGAEESEMHHVEFLEFEK